MPLRLQKKARHFGEAFAQEGKRSGSFWLYVVTEAGTDQPELHCIQSPTTHFRVGEDIFATGYIIQEGTWRQKTRGGPNS